MANHDLRHGMNRMNRMKYTIIYNVDIYDTQSYGIDERNNKFELSLDKFDHDSKMFSLLECAKLDHDIQYQTDTNARYASFALAKTIKLIG